MKRLIFATVLLAISASLLHSTDAPVVPEEQVRAVIQQFEQGLRDRNLATIEAVVADDLVALENGHRNDGWKDFRENHLVPEMREPAPPSRSEIIRIATTQEMGWGYTKTEMTLTRKNGEKAEATVWSVYVLEKRNGNWKIVLLDWSIRVQPPGKK